MRRRPSDFTIGTSGIRADPVLRGIVAMIRHDLRYGRSRPDDERKAMSKAAMACERAARALRDLDRFDREAEKDDEPAEKGAHRQEA